MRRVETLAKILAALFILGAFLASLVHLFALRFERGDVYPPYSTLRTDPLGARAYYEALARLPRISVERNLRPLPRLQMDAPATFFVLGIDRYTFRNVEENNARELEHLASLGGRIVIAFAPGYQASSSAGPMGRSFTAPPITPSPTPSPTPTPIADDAAITPEPSSDSSATSPTSPIAAAPTPTPAVSDDYPSFMGGRPVSLEERWGVGVRLAPFPGDSEGRMGAVEARLAPEAPPDLPPVLSWHSAMAFSLQDDRWRTIYARGDDTPVAIERPWGRGSILLLSDAYYFSNEAARHDRQPALLAWAAGPHARLIFNETHHGLLEEPGVMGLAREYHLEGTLIALLVLALLFVWRNASSLVPRGAAAKPSEPRPAATGRAATASLVPLLRRHIPPGALLSACFDEWRQTLGPDAKRLRDQAALMESIVYYESEKPARERNAAAAYREMTRILHERRIRRDPNPR